MHESVQVPDKWSQVLERDMGARTIVLGAPGVGKSTFCRWLFRELGTQHRLVGYLDGDPGQSQLGPPTTITLAISDEHSGDFPPAGKRWRWSIGATSPTGHMLPMLAGVARLIDRARDHAVGAIILDTTGLIDPAQGGHALKWALMDILQPSSVIGLVYRDELSTLLAPVQARAREAVIELPPASRARPRSTEERRAYRSTRFREHFEGAHTHGVPWGAFGVFPERQFERRRLLSIEDRAGFTLGLGIVTGLDRASKRVILKTPLASLEAAAAIRLADILLDPNSFRETKQRLDQSR